MTYILASQTQLRLAYSAVCGLAVMGKWSGNVESGKENEGLVNPVHCRRPEGRDWKRSCRPANQLNPGDCDIHDRVDM